jgi:GntR family transcriptional regulator
LSRYEDVAADLREKIRSGEYPVGSTLPKYKELQVQYQISTTTARAVVALLESEGLVQAIRRRGTVVQGHPAIRRMIARDRVMERDAAGYYSGPDVQNWARVAGTQTTVTTRPAPPEIADLLQVEPGTAIHVRGHVVGSPDDSALCQTSDSWLHPDLVRDLPILATGRTGDGGTYDRIEEWVKGPVAWSEIVTAHAPSPEETAVLQLPPGAPVLRILRISAVGRGTRTRVIEVSDVRMSAALFGVRYPLDRGSSARWPVAPAGSDFYSDRLPGANPAQ